MIINGPTVGTPTPRTNYEQTDPKKADYLKGKAVLDEKIQEAKTAANNAQTAADKAQTTADSAKSAASKAQTSANNAKTAADNAQTTADSATTAANKAQTSADTANTAANKAQTSANNAQTAADNAQAAAVNAQTAANNAQTAANNAQNSANNALNLIPKARPYNYLDNSDFGSPVNKRGKEAYTAAGYSIDRWRQTNDIIAVRIADGHIQLEKNAQASSTAKTVMFQQFIELPSHLKGKDVTLAARVIGGAVRLNINNNTNQQSTYKYDYTKWQTVILNGTATSKNDEFYVALQLSNNYGDINCNCAWIALYEGIYTEDNLPEYQPKGHMVEELNCGALTFRGDLTLSASKWSSSAPYSQSVSVVGITEDTDPHIYPVYSDTLATAKAQKEAFAMVSRGKTSDGAIQFICFEDKPTVDIPVRYEVNR